MQVCLQVLLKRWSACMEAPVEFGELALKSSLAKLLSRLDALAGAAPPKRCSLAENLPLTGCTEDAQSSNGLLQTLPSPVLEVLQMPTILHLALIFDDQLGWALLGRKILVPL